MGARVAQLVVVLSGPVAAGKSTLARHLHERYGGSLVKTQQALRERAEAGGLGDIHGRRELQEYGERLDAETDGRWVAEVARRQVDQVDKGLVIIDAVRIASQIDALRSEFGRRLVHVHVSNSSGGELSDRYSRRSAEGASGLEELPNYAQVIANPTEASVPQLADIADAVLDTAPKV
jgi:adenylosuccinate synthase